MFHLYGFFTQNSLKALYVLQAIGEPFEFHFTDLSKGEQRTDEFAAMTPMKKVPVLKHGDDCLFESGAICRYVANVSHSPLYPDDAMARGRVDQWMDFFTCHLGRWFTTMFYENIIKPKFGLGEPDAPSLEEANKFAAIQLKVLEKHLSDCDWLANDALSIADLFAFAYMEQHRAVDYSLAAYPNVSAWFERVEALDCIREARALLPDMSAA